MSHPFRKRLILFLAAVIMVLRLDAPGQEPASGPQEQEKKQQLRFICVSSLEKEQEVVLATRNDKGEWLEHGTIKLRSSFISEWLPAATGEMHVALREAAGLKSICKFNYPASASHALVVLIADPRNERYRADVVDPQKLKFKKGSLLVVNFTSVPGIVVLGSNKVAVQPGQRVVAEPALEENGMYRLMVAYLDSGKKPVPCYDRYVPGNPDSRDMMFLFPDPKLGLKIFNLPMFGDMN